jgi:uncharacterized protein
MSFIPVPGVIQMFSFRQAVAPALLVLAAGVIGTVRAADADPTPDQIYVAANSGHLAEAQQMIDQVLRDHPQSAKAHYVAAELDARGGNFTAARQELVNAETLDPSRHFAQPAAIAALRSELSQSTSRNALVPGAPGRPSFPWLPVLLIGGGIAIAWMYLRRRAQQAALQSPYPGGVATGGPGAFPGVVGGGSGIVGGLASGLAVGAGIAAGEELVRHVFEGDRAVGGVMPADPNANMGGNDFGVSDSSSWDDNSGSSGDDGGGSGGGDWT